jgi:hypothetical protein
MIYYGQNSNNPNAKFHIYLLGADLLVEPKHGLCDHAVRVQSLSVTSIRPENPSESVCKLCVDRLDNLLDNAEQRMDYEQRKYRGE